MTNKSDVLSIFIKWKKYVECYFNQKMKVVQSDWGDEYRLLKIFPNLWHYSSCFLPLHTPPKWCC